jgi:drug/metabolite transporter (DMT)-like permease
MSGEAQFNSLIPMGYFLAVTATVIWGGNFFIARAFNDDIPPVGLAFWRWTIAIITVAPFALRSTIAEWKLVQKNLPYLAVSALSGVTAVNTLIYIAGHTTQAINLSLIAAASPVFVVLMSRIFYGDRISLTRAAGIAVVLVGVVLLVARGSLERLLSISFAIGDLYMLLAAIIFASYTMLVKQKPAAMNMKTFILCIFSLGWLFLTPFYLLESSIDRPVVFTPAIAIALLYIGIPASVMAFFAWNQAIVLIGPSRAALIYYLIPVFSGIAAWIFLGEAIELLHIFSMLLIVCGILITNRSESGIVESSSKQK